MSSTQLFEYAIIWHPTEKDAEKGTKSKLLVPPATILADSTSKVLMAASMSIPEEYKEDLDQIDIAVRPF